MKTTIAADFEASGHHAWRMEFHKRWSLHDTVWAPVQVTEKALSTWDLTGEGNATTREGRPLVVLGTNLSAKSALMGCDLRAPRDLQLWSLLGLAENEVLGSTLTKKMWI